MQMAKVSVSALTAAFFLHVDVCLVRAAADVSFY
jgi:hypothetical protein